MRREDRDNQGQLIRLEANPATAADEEAARNSGLIVSRRILQLRIDLPLTPDPRAITIATRRFAYPHDAEEFLAVNNRAFHWHPDQSGWTSKELSARMAEPWFDANGFLLHERHGKLAGFCWTKIHEATETDPALGEIFVIAVDPDFHGLGLGRALTVAGLTYLTTQHLNLGMLHVEADNTAACALYRDLGFVDYDSHCWWALPEADTASVQ